MSGLRKAAMPLAFALALGATASLAARPASADSIGYGIEGSVTGSARIAEGSLAILDGGSQIASASGVFVIESIQATGEGLSLVLQGAGEASRVVVTGLSETVGLSAQAVGQSVIVIATSAGYILESAGRVIAFVPNEIGRSLVYSSYHGARP